MMAELGKDSFRLAESDYGSLVGNLEQILQFQASFLKTLEEHVR